MYKKLLLPLVISSLAISPVSANDDLIYTVMGSDASSGSPMNFSSMLSLSELESDLTRISSESDHFSYTVSFEGTEAYTITRNGDTWRIVSEILDLDETFTGAGAQENILGFTGSVGSPADDTATPVPTPSTESVSYEQAVLAHISDGRPDSNTAISANQTFDSGLDASTPKAKKDATSAAAGGVQILAGSSSFEVDGVDGNLFQLPLEFQIPMSGSRVGSLRVPLAYSEVGDAEAYHAGLQFSVPFTVHESGSSTWVLSPSIGASATFSDDFDNQSSVFNLGLTSSYTHQFDRCYLTIGNHISNYAISDVEVDGVTIADSDDQQIVKNGIKLTVPLEAQGWELEGYLIHTAFLGDASVDEYFTPGVQITKEHPEYGRLTIRLESDIGEDYDSFGVHFGAGFQF